MRKVRQIGAFLLWLLLLLELSYFAVVVTAAPAPAGIDFLSYRRAADAIEQGSTPYLSPRDTQAIWRTYHHYEQLMLSAYRDGTSATMMQTLLTRPPQPGPYLYPPTLALLIADLGVTKAHVAFILFLATLGFAWLWLRTTGASTGWLLCVILSFDIQSTFTGGNIELILLFLSLLAAWLIFTFAAQRRSLWAAPCIALVVLIKPFYALFFIAIATLVWSGHRKHSGAVVTRLLELCVLTTGLIAVDVVRWGTSLRADALSYLTHATQYQSFALPIAEQTPISAWNRTPTQVFVSLGLTPIVAQGLALALALGLLVIAIYASRRRQLPFSLLYALALVVVYAARPVGWGFVYLDVVVGTAVWSTSGHWQRRLLVGVFVALLASHVWAIVRTAQGAGMPLLTAQSASFPWETVLVLGGAALLLVRTMLVSSGQHTDRLTRTLNTES